MDEGDLYVVVAREGAPEFDDCQLAREDEPIPDTHMRVFGPDTEWTCEAWKAYNCDMRAPSDA